MYMLAKWLEKSATDIDKQISKYTKYPLISCKIVNIHQAF